jgi:hypothetical protein
MRRVSSSFLFPEFYGTQDAGGILFPRLVKKVQIQGDAPQAERGVLEVRRSECQGAGTQ